MLMPSWLRNALPVGVGCLALLAGWGSMSRPQAARAQAGDVWQTAKFLGAGTCIRCHTSGPKL